MSTNKNTENIRAYAVSRLGLLEMPATETTVERVQSITEDLEHSAAFVRKDLPFNLEPITGASTKPRHLGKAKT